jgi:hypothetical protein
MVKTGRPDTTHDAPSHVPGIREGGAAGSYDRQPGHLPDGRSSARRSSGINPRQEEPIDARMPNLSPA